VGIVGDRPESGVRVDLVRSAQGDPPWCYRGEATTLHERFLMTAEVSAGGDIAIELPPEAPRGLADKVRLLLRAAWKHTHEDGVPPPRRIVRWRPGG
jgi:hypothetical protein